MDQPHLIIVGAGIAGLSTGYYARLNGFRTTIFEKHKIPGGLCTAWKRKGYTFDISMHMLVGSRSGPFHQMWKELGVVPDQKFHYHEGELTRVMGREKTLSFHSDPRALEKQMVSLSPADASLVKEFMRLYTGPEMMAAASLKAQELLSTGDRLRQAAVMMPLMGVLMKYRGRTFQEFASRFRDPFLREAVLFLIDTPGWPMPDYPMLGLAGFSTSGLNDAGVPAGGSQKVVFGIAERYKGLGGELRCGCRVSDILVEKDRAVGIRLEDGSEHRGDAVVWAADGHTAIFDLLRGRYLGEQVRRMYEEWTPVRPIVQVCIGVARDMSPEPVHVVFQPESPIEIAGVKHRWIGTLHRCFDPSMAPPGKSVVEVWYPSSLEHWESLARDHARYNEEKARIANITIRELDRLWPGFAGQVEIVDVPTPLTYVRYTGNWKGSPDGWYATSRNIMEQQPVRSLPGLTDFHMVGQWTAPYTGTVIAALSGRQLIEIMCRRAGRTFVSRFDGAAMPAMKPKKGAV
jgi:phytoene dehydrogenase-like protein